VPLCAIRLVAEIRERMSSRDAVKEQRPPRWSGRCSYADYAKSSVESRLLAVRNCNYGIPLIEAIDAVNTIELPFLIRGSASCVVRSRPFWLISKVLSYCSFVTTMMPVRSSNLRPRVA